MRFFEKLMRPKKSPETPPADPEIPNEFFLRKIIEKRLRNLLENLGASIEEGKTEKETIEGKKWKEFKRITSESIPFEFDGKDFFLELKPKQDFEYKPVVFVELRATDSYAVNTLETLKTKFSDLLGQIGSEGLRGETSWRWSIKEIPENFGFRAEVTKKEEAKEEPEKETGPVKSWREFPLPEDPEVRRKIEEIITAAEKLDAKRFENSSLTFDPETESVEFFLLPLCKSQRLGGDNVLLRITNSDKYVEEDPLKRLKVSFALVCKKPSDEPPAIRNANEPDLLAIWISAKKLDKSIGDLYKTFPGLEEYLGKTNIFR